MFPLIMLFQIGCINFALQSGWSNSLTVKRRALATFPRDLGSTYSNHMAAHKHLALQFKGPDALF